MIKKNIILAQSQLHKGLLLLFFLNSGFVQGPCKFQNVLMTSQLFKYLVNGYDLRRKCTGHSLKYVFHFFHNFYSKHFSLQQILSQMRTETYAGFQIFIYVNFFSLSNENKLSQQFFVKFWNITFPQNPHKYSLIFPRVQMGDGFSSAVKGLKANFPSHLIKIKRLRGL
jgi:hypothetical protein